MQKAIAIDFDGTLCTKECLQYTLDAINTEEAACEAKKQAAEHYTEFELFDVQSIGEVRT